MAPPLSQHPLLSALHLHLLHHCFGTSHRTRPSTLSLPKTQWCSFERLGHDEIGTWKRNRGREELMTRWGWSGSHMCGNRFILPKLPILAYLQNLTGCPVWLQIMILALGFQGKNLRHSCSPIKGLFGSGLTFLIRVVSRKL